MCSSLLVWDVKNGKLVHTLIGHTEEIEVKPHINLYIVLYALILVHVLMQVAFILLSSISMHVPCNVWMCITCYINNLMHTCVSVFKKTELVVVTYACICAGKV